MSCCFSTFDKFAHTYQSGLSVGSFGFSIKYSAYWDLNVIQIIFRDWRSRIWFGSFSICFIRLHRITGRIVFVTFDWELLYCNHAIFIARYFDWPPSGCPVVFFTLSITLRLTLPYPYWPCSRSRTASSPLSRLQFFSFYVSCFHFRTTRLKLSFWLIRLQCWPLLDSARITVTPRVKVVIPWRMSVQWRYRTLLTAGWWFNFSVSGTEFVCCRRSLGPGCSCSGIRSLSGWTKVICWLSCSVQV